MMLWEEAPKIEIFGVQLYSFGLYCSIGLFFSALVLLLLCSFYQFKKGTGITLTALTAVSGILFSRLFFCVFYSITDLALPFRYWFSLSMGGFSMFGLIIGVLFGAWVCEKVLGTEKFVLRDITCCALPLAMAAERFGEEFFDEFNVSREFTVDGFPAHSFLAVRDSIYEDVSYLATYRLAAIFCIILFLVMVFFLTIKDRRDGDLFTLFMILCGAGGVLLESLRYDQFLVFSFVRFQQVVAAILMAFGVMRAALPERHRYRGLFIAAVFSLILSVGLCIYIEFALDRSSVSHYVLYAAMIASLALPSTLGILLLRKDRKEMKTVEQGT